MNISEPFIRRPVATTLLMAAIAFVGIVSFPFLPVAPLPQVDFPTIQVTTTWTGASAETMATSVAAPLEQQFGQIAGITQMTSQSALGSSTIVIQFDLERNIDSAAQDVQAAITVASKQLPQALTTPPAYKKVNPADVPVLLLSVHSDTVPLITVDEFANVFLAQQISQVNGVAQVSVFGDRAPSIRVQVDPAKLASSGITLEDIRGTLVSSTTNAAKGVINTDKITFTIAANDQITDAEKFNDVVLAYRNGAADPGARRRPGGIRTGGPHRRRLSEQPRRRHPCGIQAARRQRHRHRRQDQGRTAATHGAHPAGDQGRNHPRPHRHHPRLGRWTSNSRCCSPSAWWCW